MSTEAPNELLEGMTDLTTHHIEGFARMGNTPFRMPLVTHVEGNLWQGGSPATVEPRRLPDYFHAVLNLYPWEPYEVPEGVQYREEELYDSDEIRSTGVIFDLAEWVNARRAEGPTLVHCQAGLNRSALVTATALILAGSTPDAAITLLRKQRSPAVLCNQTFENWLRGRTFQPPTSDSRGRG